MSNPDVRGRGVGARRRRNDKAPFSGLNVVVLGGYVMDVFVRAASMPEWGRAVQASELALEPGGKGLNQAIAASRLGANVHVIGALGNDEFGNAVLHALDDAGVNTDSIDIVKDAVTPITIVFSREGGKGESSFVGWKNATRVIVDRALVRRHRRLIEDADILLCTLEVGIDAVSEALKTAHEAEVLTLLNPAPPLELPSTLAELPLDLLDYLVPNEWEAREMAGRHGGDDRPIRTIATYLGQITKAKLICITRAHNGCAVFRSGNRYREYEAFETEAEDTTGASDAFCATFALYMSSGEETEESILWAQAAGAWAVRKRGAGKHMPTHAELVAYRRQLETHSGF